MTERASALRRLAAELRERDDVDDAFLAKSFTDRLLIVDVSPGGPIPDDVEQSLAAHDLRAADEVYGDGEDGTYPGLGDVGDATRHHFVDVQTRGSHQSYVVD